MSALPVALVGCGARGLEHGEAVRAVPGLELVGVSDREEASWRAAAERFEVAGFSSAATLVAEARPAIAVVATSPRGRTELVESLLDAGELRAILAEKPLGLRLADAVELVRACERRDVALAVGHQSRFARPFMRLKEAIERGDLGEIEFLRAVGYGNLLDQGNHVVDTLRWLTGAEVEWVMSQAEPSLDVLAGLLPGAAAPRADDEHPAPMWMTHHLGFAGGLRATMETGLLYQRSEPFIDEWLQRRVTVIGSDGTAEARISGRLRVLSRRSGEIAEDDDVPAIGEATRALHADVRDSVLAGRAPQASGTDALRTLEVVLACLKSAAESQLVSLPLGRPRSPGDSQPTGDGDAPSPTVSVLVTLERERGIASESIASWGRAQDYPGRIEVVGLSDEETSSAPERLDGARVVSLPGATRSQLFDAAAREAAGDVLVFTEAHCVAHPDCLAELVGMLERARLDGVCANTVGISENVFARLDQRLFEEGFAVFSRPEDWRKVWPHGLAIRRDAYLAGGGFDTRFDLFGEQLLGARLHRQGRRIGFAERAMVRHRFGTELDEVLAHVEHATRGRELWEGHAASDDGLESLIWPPPGGRGSVDRHRALLLGLALARGVRRGGLAPGRRPGLGIAARHVRGVAPAMLGRAIELALARARTAIALARCHLWRWDDRRAELPYRDLWLRVVEESRVRHRRPPPESARIDGPGRRPIGTIPNGFLAAFAEPFVHAGEVVRWTGPAFGLDTALPRGRYEVRLELADLRSGADVAGLTAYLGSRRLPPACVHATPDGVVLRPERELPGDRQRWVLTCAPAHVRQERTGHMLELGLPVSAITVAAT